MQRLKVTPLALQRQEGMKDVLRASETRERLRETETKKKEERVQLWAGAKQILGGANKSVMNERLVCVDEGEIKKIG